jgi:hypothetical protein
MLARLCFFFSFRAKKFAKVDEAKVERDGRLLWGSPVISEWHCPFTNLMRNFTEFLMNFFNELHNFVPRSTFSYPTSLRRFSRNY